MNPEISKNCVWLDPDAIKPTDNQEVAFIDKVSPETIYKGSYIKSQDMFFIGFADVGNFRFSREILKWISLKDYQNG